MVDGAYLAESRADQLGKVSCGKSCIRFSSLDRLDRAELTALLQDAVAAMLLTVGAVLLGSVL